MSTISTAKTAKVMKRGCGGWLAISGADEAIKIGAEAQTEAEAIAKLQTKLREWRKLLLASDRKVGPTEF